MKPLYRFLIVCAALFGVACCNSSQHSTADFTEVCYAPRYATGFSIHRQPDKASTLVTVRNPWQGADNISQQLLVMRDEAPIPHDFTGTVVVAPVRKVICMSSSHVAMFETLGATDRIVGVSGADFISNPRIRERYARGEVYDMGYDSNLNFELLTALRPDLILLYGVTSENTSITGKLRELNIPYIYIGDYLEAHPLGKTEWVQLIAEVCDLRSQGEQLFEGVVDRYEAIVHKINRHLDTSPAGTVSRPQVLLNTPYRDMWFIPPTKNYTVQLIRDAGGDTYTISDGSNSSKPIEMEQAYRLAAEADIWLNVGNCNTLAELKAQNPRFAEMPIVQKKQVYNNNRRQTPAGGSDFWESGTMQPDLILQDLATILHPEAFDASLCYYKRLE